MGLLDRLRGIGEPVEGQYLLTSCSMNSGGAVYENCSMEGVLSGPGLAPTAVRHSTLTAPTEKWPEPGDTLPVTFDRDRPDRLKIRWDRMPSNRERAHAAAEQQAQAMARQAATDQVPTGQAPAGRSTTQDAPSAVLGAPGRAAPGAVGGGLTPEESAAALAGGGASLGLQQASARVLAAHEVAVPAGLPQAPGGVWDLTLDVAPATGPGYSTVLRIGFSSPERRATVARIGRDLPVLVNPDRPDRVAVDTSRPI